MLIEADYQIQTSRAANKDNHSKGDQKDTTAFVVDKPNSDSSRKRRTFSKNFSSSTGDLLML